MQKVFQNIVFDLWDVTRYLPVSVLTGSAVFLLICLILRKTKKQRNWGYKKRGVLFLLLIYLLQVAMITFFSREPGSRRGIDWQFFETWRTDAKSRAFVIENVLLFLPLGVLLPLSGKSFQKIEKCMLMGLLISCSIELMQLLTGRRYCQLDDVVMNVFGTVIGFTFFKILLKRLRSNCGS